MKGQGWQRAVFQYHGTRYLESMAGVGFLIALGTWALAISPLLSLVIWGVAGTWGFAAYMDWQGNDFWVCLRDYDLFLTFCRHLFQGEPGALLLPAWVPMGVAECWLEMLAENGILRSVNGYNYCLDNSIQDLDEIRRRITRDDFWLVVGGPLPMPELAGEERQSR